ncbi:hypothetical protein [Endozoicomonas montiporae]|uniref:hypothetical protein n=1 Tax=Endozoicomonas montiporae TaxID=1027273 RepID=UPI0039B763F4
MGFPQFFIVIHPNHRNHGYGRLLIHFIKLYARLFDLPFLIARVVHGNEPMQHILPRENFIRIGLKLEINRGWVVWYLWQPHSFPERQQTQFQLSFFPFQ